MGRRRRGGCATTGGGGGGVVVAPREERCVLCNTPAMGCRRMFGNLGLGCKMGLLLHPLRPGPTEREQRPVFLGKKKRGSRDRKKSTERAGRRRFGRWTPVTGPAARQREARGDGAGGRDEERRERECGDRSSPGCYRGLAGVDRPTTKV